MEHLRLAVVIIRIIKLYSRWSRSAVIAHKASIKAGRVLLYQVPSAQPLTTCILLLHLTLKVGVSQGGVLCPHLFNEIVITTYLEMLQSSLNHLVFRSRWGHRKYQVKEWNISNFNFSMSFWLQWVKCLKVFFINQTMCLLNPGKKMQQQNWWVKSY